jgi:acetyl-CoA carboxylase carboxyl transferase subunit beta
VDAVVPPHGLATLARRALEVMCAAPAGQAPEPPVRPEPPLGPEPPVGPVRLDPLPGPEPPDQAVRPEPPVRPEPLLGPEPPGPPVRPEPPVQPGLPDVPAWEVVERSRRATRPGVVALLTAAAGSVTRLADPGPGLVLALARFGAAPCVLIGQDRRGPAPGPDGVRAARRGLRLATELRLPLVSVIDTAGAELSRRAEEGGLAAEIARSVAELLALPVPTLCLLLGQGAGGAALAHLPADRLVAAQHGWLSPLPPEGAAAILHRDADRAPELAAALRIRASDLLAVGIVDYVVPEYPDAAAEPMRFLRRVGAVLAAELAALLDRDPAERLAARAARYAR